MPERHELNPSVHLWMKEVVEDMTMYSRERGLPRTAASLRRLLSTLCIEIGIEPLQTATAPLPSAEIIHLINRQLKLVHPSSYGKHDRRDDGA
jgi:hypothetical protein